jgi:hypothetical protein
LIDRGGAVQRPEMQVIEQCGGMSPAHRPDLFIRYFSLNRKIQPVRIKVKGCRVSAGETGIYRQEAV